MSQYWDIKSAHEDKILLFRMGDFFELFHRDAEIAAPILGIALTSRNKKSADETPMCGVPHHSIAGPINKLLAAGYKVAICDQIEDPKFAKGIVKRAVTRILSPGVVYDPETLEAAKSHYLAAMDEKTISFLDLTTGEAFFYHLQALGTVARSARERLLDVLNPVEIIGSDEQIALWKTEAIARPTSIFARSLLSSHAGLEKLSNEADPSKVVAESARRLVSYARYMQGDAVLSVITDFEPRELMQRLDLGPTVVRHLEIFENYRGEPEGSLFHAVNRCRTSAGTRLLRRWLQFPLANQTVIEGRLDRVEAWRQDVPALKDLRRALGGMGDIERRLGKIANPGCNPRDLLALAEALEAGLEASRIASADAWPEKEMREAADMIAQLRSTLVDEPPVQTKNGHFIRVGVDPQLDELIELSTNSHQKIMELEAREKELTGISSLKVRFNNVFGYYIEITHTHKDKVPDRYQRKQTLANAERYLTKELEDLEHRVLTAQGKRIELELAIFDDIRKRALERSSNLLKLARLWSELDVISAAAWLAVEQNYCRPLFDAASGLRLKASRHPVVEQSLSIPFVANDIELAPGQALLLTGPNMAGKSTIMRQVAIAAILAQAGLFVPAQEARLPLFDRIFTRIGASDFLAEGLSTFMVEMKETAEMLGAATSRSLVILDEVGRGTSTFDGMSLAQAILEYLLESAHSMTLFATHYHELTRLSARYAQLVNAHMAIHEKGGSISFLHSLVRGPANKSYGIQVARLAGLPSVVTKRAGHILRELESSPRAETPQLSLLDHPGLDNLGADHSTVETESEDTSTGARDPREDKVLGELQELVVERMTPLDALLKLQAWKDDLSSLS
ncbi:MAG: DNA mismatch repair protein MutS [Bdellovibrionaceae bacterium]|nr:DNA mismatch repair protein MutS [Pseudobdellovibrionaceae bacterium]